MAELTSLRFLAPYNWDIRICPPPASAVLTMVHIFIMRPPNDTARVPALPTNCPMMMVSTVL